MDQLLNPPPILPDVASRFRGYHFHKPLPAVLQRTIEESAAPRGDVATRYCSGRDRTPATSCVALNVAAYYEQ